MGLFGGDSVSETKNITQTRNTSQGAQDSATVVGEGANFNYEMVNTDAVSVIKETNAFLGETFNSVLGLLDSSQQATIDAVSDSNDAVVRSKSDQENAGATSLIKSTIPIIGIVTAGYVAYKVFSK